MINPTQHYIRPVETPYWSYRPLSICPERIPPPVDKWQLTRYLRHSSIATNPFRDSSVPLQHFPQFLKDRSKKELCREPTNWHVLWQTSTPDCCRLDNVEKTVDFQEIVCDIFFLIGVLEGQYMKSFARTNGR